MSGGLETLALEPEPGERIQLDRLPGDSPAYVFLHGLGSVRTGQKSAALLRHAEGRNRAYCRFDFRGHGGSSGRIGFTTVGELIRDTACVLDLMGPSILFGSSLGGLVAAFAAAQHPEQVRGLVLVAPAFGFMQRMERRLDAAGNWRVEDLSFPVHRRVLEDAARLDESGLPQRIRVPVLVVHGTADQTVPRQLSQRFFDALAAERKEFWLIEDGDHRLNELIGEILGRMDALIG